MDKMVVFKAKIWLMQKRTTTTKKGGGEKREGKKAAVMHSDPGQSGLQGQLLDLTVVLETTNGAFMSCVSRGCSEAVKSAHEMMSGRLSCCSTVKRLKKD